MYVSTSSSHRLPCVGVLHPSPPGQLGEDDVIIQTVRMQAEQGHVPSMMELADLYYWGNHGLPRDQAQSFRWFQRAADLGNPVAQFACGNLLRKGEGVGTNHTAALEYFRLAAAKNNTRALNGLGIAYLEGTGGVEANHTMAFAYFQRAAAQMQDGDSLFNEGARHGTARHDWRTTNAVGCPGT